MSLACGWKAIAWWVPMPCSAAAKRSLWWVSVITLSIETALTLIIGSLSLTDAYAESIGRTAWRAFGADYGFVPLIQPLLGLIWLVNGTTRQAYGFGETKEEEDTGDS